MYHFELRKFPHAVCRFNQSEHDVLSVVRPWVKDEWVEQGERKWHPQEATLTVLEGPELAMSDLAMGRGWRNAQRRSEDVTERVLAAARAGAARHAAAAGAVPAGASPPGASRAAKPAQGGTGEGADLLADSLGLELLALLDNGPLPLARVWMLVQERVEGVTPAQSLALGDAAVRSLLDRGLVLLQGIGGEPGGEDANEVLHTVASWFSGTAGAVAIARSS